MDRSDRLCASQRTESIERLRSEALDILVIGGGVTGVACALEAASRGLDVALVEQRDIASGTSSRSSKLIHGGLRYLEFRDFGLVHEALRERSVLMKKVAPHLMRPMPFLLPVPGRVWRRFYYGAGVFLYDLLASVSGSNALPWHRHVSAERALELCPSLKRGTFSGAILYYDAQIDDARHTLAVARTAAKYGAAIATSVEVTELIREGGRVVGAELLDRETGETWSTRAKCVVNAAGVWSTEIQEMSGVSSDISIRVAKGVHIVVPRNCIEGETAVILKTEVSVLLAIPWGEHWLIGTTDTPWEGDLAHPAATRRDIEYILEHVNSALASPISKDDISGVFAGLRPLVDTQADSTAKVSREHVVTHSPGLVSIAGGKYTTYRVMAADTIDEASGSLDRTVPGSISDRIPLVGSEDWEEWSDRAPELAAEFELTIGIIERLLGRYGSRISELLEVLTEDDKYSQQLPGGEYIAAEVVYAARYEGALHVDDVLARRLRIYMESPDRGVAAAGIVAPLLGQELGWDEGRVRLEEEAWQLRVAAERAANGVDGDEQASTERDRAPDFRSLSELS